MSGCVPFYVHTDYDPAVDFTYFRTYAWQPRTEQPNADPRLNNDIMDSRVRTAVERVLQARGYQPATDVPPDFRVAYYLLIEPRTEVYSFPVTYGWGYWGWWGWYGTETYVDQYELGTLIIDVIDAGTNRLIWRGSAAARVVYDESPEERTQRVNEAVEKILERFPPTKPSNPDAA
jgi:hypothetical protein